MVGPPQALGGVGATVIQEQDVQGVGKGMSEGVHEAWDHVDMQQIGACQEEALTRRGGHGAIDRAPFEGVLDHPDGLDPLGRQAPSANGQEAEGAFILAKDPDGTPMRGRDDLLEAFSTGSLERGDGLRIFWCDWAAAPGASP